MILDLEHRPKSSSLQFEFPLHFYLSIFLDLESGKEAINNRTRTSKTIIVLLVINSVIYSPIALRRNSTLLLIDENAIRELTLFTARRRMKIKTTTIVSTKILFTRIRKTNHPYERHDRGGSYILVQVWSHQQRSAVCNLAIRDERPARCTRSILFSSASSEYECHRLCVY